MAEFPPKSLDVAVTAIRRNDLILAGFNPAWGAFTLPMSKRRQWAMPDDPQMVRWEPWEEAAVRNVVEWFGHTLLDEPRFLLEVREFRQSDRDLVVKEYNFQVFTVTSPEGEALVDGAIAEWLTVEQFLDVRRRPISPTARFLIGELQKNKLL